MRHIKKYETFLLENTQYQTYITPNKYNYILNRIDFNINIPIKGYELSYQDFNRFIKDYYSGINTDVVDKIYNQYKKDIDIIIDNLNENSTIKNILILATIFILGVSCEKENIDVKPNKVVQEWVDNSNTNNISQKSLDKIILCDDIKVNDTNINMIMEYFDKENPIYRTNNFGDNYDRILLFNNLPYKPKISESHYTKITYKTDKTYISFNYLGNMLNDFDKKILLENILNLNISFFRNDKLERIYINGDDYISTIFENNLLISDIDENTNINVDINYIKSPIFEKKHRDNLGYWVDQKYFKQLFDIKINNR